MSALAILGLVCILLFCFGPAISILFDLYKKKPKATKYVMHAEKINNINYWDYLVLIVPGWLLLIVLFSPDQREQEVSLIGLGIGYTMLILSSYNRRIDKPKANFFLLLISLVLAGVVAVSPLLFNISVPNMAILYWPLIAYLYLIFARHIIKLITGYFPITVDRNYGVGKFHEPYNRKTNYWDLLWSMFNLFIITVAIILAF